MRGKSIARALEGLGSDPEMRQHLLSLEEALTAVLGAEEVECAHCGRKELDLDSGEIPELADRLFTVVCEVQARMEGRLPRRPRDVCPDDARGQAWKSCHPDLRAAERRSRNPEGEQGGAR